eukprot:SAG25_NODE_4147_length_879_cov_5.049080_2_plen_54_part_01
MGAGVSILCAFHLTEIYLCHTSSCHEIERIETPRQAVALHGGGDVYVIDGDGAD